MTRPLILANQERQDQRPKLIWILSCDWVIWNFCEPFEAYKMDAKIHYHFISPAPTARTTPQQSLHLHLLFRSTWKFKQLAARRDDLGHPLLPVDFLLKNSDPKCNFECTYSFQKKRNKDKLNFGIFPKRFTTFEVGLFDFQKRKFKLLEALDLIKMFLTQLALDFERKIIQN